VTDAEERFLLAYDVLVMLLNRDKRPAALNFAVEVGVIADRYAAANKLPLVSDAGATGTSRRGRGYSSAPAASTGD
jgi:hypothetical protein